MDKQPRTYEEFAALWPHQPLALTHEQRLGLPEIKWENYTAPAYTHQQSHGALGTWTIGHQDAPRADGTFEPVSIGYQLPFPEGMDYLELSNRMRELEEGSVERAQMWACMKAQELGYAFDQSYARRFVELARQDGGEKQPHQALIDGGFQELEPMEVHGDPVRRFSLSDGRRGAFTAFLSSSYLRLIHEKRDAMHWTNLLSVNLGQLSYNKDKWLPVFWSPEVASPLGAAAVMAVEMTRQWEPERRPTRGRKGPA